MSIRSIRNSRGPHTGKVRRKPVGEVSVQAGELLTVIGAAGVLGLSVSCLNKWRITGEGPAWHRCGRAVRYSRPDLAAWLAANRQMSTSDGGPRAA
jgi:hypothetical protein